MAGLAENILGLLIFTAIAAICLLWPEKIQRWGIKHYSKSKLLRYNPLLGYVKSPYYLWQVRVSGFLALLASFVLVVSLIGQVVQIFRG